MMCGTLPIVIGMAGMIRRDGIVAEALSWVGTPYIPRARVKSGGCDCLTFPLEVMIACGLAKREELPHYNQDWYHHTTEEKYILLLARYTEEIAESFATPTERRDKGNIIVVKTCGAQLFNHSAIIIDWPIGLHSIKDGGVTRTNLALDPMWLGNEIAIYDPFAGAYER